MRNIREGSNKGLAAGCGMTKILIAGCGIKMLGGRGICVF